MRRSLAAIWIAVTLVAAWGMAPPQQAPAPRSQLKVGDTAPAFSLPDQEGKTVQLSDFLGKQNVVLAFYVLAFTGG